MSRTSSATVPLSRERSERSLATAKYLVLAAAFLGWMFDGLEMGIFPQIVRSALGKLLVTADENTIKSWHQIIDACFLFGAAAGGLIFGWMGDRVGRVRAMSLSILVYSLFTALLFFAQSPWQMGVLRFIAAIGMGGEWALGVALVMEVWDERHRPILAGMIGAAANVGFVIIGIAGTIVHVTPNNWRGFVLIGAVPALLTFFIRLFVPESPKWQEAQRIAPSRPLEELFGDPKLRKTVLFAIAFASIALLGTWGAVQKIPAWVGGIPNGAGSQGVVQIAIGIGAILGCMAAPFLAAATSRRMCYFILCAGSLFSCQLLFRKLDTYNFGFLFMTFIVGALTAALYGWLPLYLPELFPTRVRATAQGIAFNFGRILAGFGTLASGMIGNSYAEMGSTVSSIYVLGMIFIFFAPETKGKPMPA